MGGWNHWKLTAIGMALVATTALITGLVVAHWKGPEADLTAKESAAGAQWAPTHAASPQPVVPAPSRPAARAPQPVAVAPAPAVSPQPVSTIPTREAVEVCNRYAAAQADQQDKTTEVTKDAVVGAVAGAVLGAAGGAIAGGGKGAGKGAAIGGVVGAGGGTLYGLNENKKHDEAYRAAYATCMRSRGYSG